MVKNNNLINSSINKKFIKPLKHGCRYNVKKLDGNVKHDETKALLIQAHKTLENVEYNLINFNLVDSNTLLRSAFENIMMAMEIQFDERVYNEFIDLSINEDNRNYTKVNKIRNRFKTHLNEISKVMFEDISMKEKKHMLNDLYDKLCKFTHSTLIVSTIVKVQKKEEKDTLKFLMSYNYYFVKLLLFLCLKYLTKDEKHYIAINNLYYSYILSLLVTLEKISKCDNLASIFGECLYKDKNVDYFENNRKEAEKLKNGLIEHQELVNKMSSEFNQGLKEFLS